MIIPILAIGLEETREESKKYGLFYVPSLSLWYSHHTRRQQLKVSQLQLWQKQANKNVGAITDQPSRNIDHETMNEGY